MTAQDRLPKHCPEDSDKNARNVQRALHHEVNQERRNSGHGGKVDAKRVGEEAAHELITKNCPDAQREAVREISHFAQTGGKDGKVFEAVKSANDTIDGYNKAKGQRIPHMSGVKPFCR